MNITQPQNWSNAAFMRERATATNPFYEVAPATWDEQRLFLDAAISALEVDSATEAALPGASNSKLAAAIKAEFAEIQAPPPGVDPTSGSSGYAVVPRNRWSQQFQLGDARLQLNLSSGALSSFIDRNGVEWASATSPLFQFMYRHHSYEEKCEYTRSYVYSHGGDHPYSPGSYSPPSPELNTTARLESRALFAPVSNVWAKALSSSSSSSSTVTSVLVQLNGSAMGNGYSAFGAIWLNYSVATSKILGGSATGQDSADPDGGGHSSMARSEFGVELVWTSKTPTRLPESVWLEVRPKLTGSQQKTAAAVDADADAGRSGNEQSPSWNLHVDKLGTMVDVTNVVKNGGAALHGLNPAGSVQWSRTASSRGGEVPRALASDASVQLANNNSNDGSGGGGGGMKFRIWSLDAASVAPGHNVNIWAWDAYNNGTAVRPTDGAAFCLWNNLWHTNYPLWYPWNSRDVHSRFRFKFSSDF